LISEINTAQDSLLHTQIPFFPLDFIPYLFDCQLTGLTLALQTFTLLLFFWFFSYNSYRGEKKKQHKKDLMELIFFSGFLLAFGNEKSVGDSRGTGRIFF